MNVIIAFATFFSIIFHLEILAAPTRYNRLISKADTLADVIRIGTNRQLLADDYIIAHVAGNARKRLHNPVPEEVVIEHDAPWEGSYCNNHSIFRDGSIFRMYY